MIESEFDISTGRYYFTVEAKPDETECHVLNIYNRSPHYESKVTTSVLFLPCWSVIY